MEGWTPGAGPAPPLDERRTTGAGLVPLVWRKRPTSRLRAVAYRLDSTNKNLPV